jgi:hypothetical protein
MTATATMTALLGDVSGGISAWKDSDLIAALLILVLGMALGMGVTCLLLVVHFLRKGRIATSGRIARKPDFFPRERRFYSSLYHLPSRWLAIRTNNPHLVQAALGLHHPRPCSWEEGLSAAHERKLFISPAVRGWILVMGAHLPEPGEDVDRCFCFLLELSRKLGQVQFFGVNRPVNHHAWILADSGSIQRAYVWAGKTLWNQGKMTRAEMELSLKCFDYGEGEERIEFGRVDPAVVNTERLPLLAARWSVDPTSIDGRILRENHGIAGQVSRSSAR